MSGKQPSVPGLNACSLLMLPFRIALFLPIFALFYSILLPLALARAVYLRIVYGKPSKILSKGTMTKADGTKKHLPGSANYISQMLFSQPFDEVRLKAALVSVAGEDHIEEHEVELNMRPAEVTEWPESGTWPIRYFTPETVKNGTNFLTAAGDLIGKKAKVSWTVFNGAAEKPTVVIYCGSGMGWDGSSNFNFMREVIHRYLGNAPNPVFQMPQMDPASAPKFDRGSFCIFLLKQPYHLGRALGGMLWNLIRAAKWSGGNGIGPCIRAMNFTKEESLQLYAGCKALGATPYAAFSFAAVKATRAVLGMSPSTIVQQASLQTRHFPVEGQGNARNFVGDWLIGPVQRVGATYDLATAQRGHAELMADLNEVGPMTLNSFMAKAYGLLNSGAGTFEIPPTFNDDSHMLSRAIFMNNYGVRSMPEGSNFVAWNWNAPMWLGVNTICVDGRTTTLVGSSFWGGELVEAMRDHMLETLREIMSHHDDAKGVEIPTYQNKVEKSSTTPRELKIDVKP